MVNGIFNLAASARDLGLEQSDALLQLRYGQRIEVLARELSGWIVGSAGKIVRVHGTQGRARAPACQAPPRRVVTDLRRSGLDVAP